MPARYAYSLNGENYTGAFATREQALDAALTAVLVVMVALVLIESGRQWAGVLSGREDARVKETPFVMTRLAEERG